MASRYYRIVVEPRLAGTYEVKEPGGSSTTWTHKTATAWVHETKLTEGTKIRIERAKHGTEGRSGCYHPWLPHRTYTVDPDGVVRRTDR
jgi:hypothetical protein